MGYELNRINRIAIEITRILLLRYVWYIANRIWADVNNEVITYNEITR